MLGKPARAFGHANHSQAKDCPGHKRESQHPTPPTTARESVVDQVGCKDADLYLGGIAAADAGLAGVAVSTRHNGRHPCGLVDRLRFLGHWWVALDVGRRVWSQGNRG